MGGKFLQENSLHKQNLCIRMLQLIGSEWHFRFSCITRLKIHHQLENQCKELFSTELHWEIFCCITSYDHNSKKRLGHVTSLESKMAERDVSMHL